jgi:hypothetical protein
MPVIGYDEAQEKDARHRHVRDSRETAISSPAEQSRIEDDADRSHPVVADGEPSASADGETVWVLIRRLNSSCKRSVALVVRRLRQRLGGRRGES